MKRRTAIVLSTLGFLAISVNGAAKTKITFSTDWPPSEFKAFIVEFEKKHPNIDVAMTAALTPEKIWTQIASGAPPDVFYVRGTDSQTYIQSGVVEPLDKYIKASNVKMTDFITEGLKPYKDKKGSIYALPYDWCPVMTFYNRSHLKAAGIPNLTDKFTTDDLMVYAKKLRVMNGDRISRWGLTTSMGGWTFEGEFLKAFGGRLFNDDETQVLITTRESVKALEFWQRLWSDKLVGGSFPKTASMNFGGTWDFKVNSKLKEDWDIAPLPKGPADYAGTAMGSGYSIAKNSKKKKEAWTLVNELMGPLGMELVWSKGTTPSRRSGLKHFYALYKNLDTKWVEFSMDRSWAGRPMLPPGEMTTNTVMQPSLDKLMQLKISPEQAAQNIKREIEALWKSKRRTRR